MSLVAEDRPERQFTYQWASGLVTPVLAVVLAILVGGVVVLASGSSPITAYQQLALGAFGTPYDMTETIIAGLPLMLTGLAVAFAFRAGLFNIGGEGQLYIGAIASTYVGYRLNLNPVLLIAIAILAAALGGAVWAGIGGLLKAWRGAHEVITTMMLNYIAIAVIGYLLESTPSGKPGPLQCPTASGNPTSCAVNAHLPVIIPSSWIPNDRLNAGLFVALAAALAFWFILWRSTLGYKIRAVGLNQKAAAYAGINVGLILVVSMLIAGAFAGMAGMVTVFGIAPYNLGMNFSPGYGFNAIAVALLGRNTALGTLVAALLFGAFTHGGSVMQAQAGISLFLVDVVQGLIIFFVGADALIRYLARKGMITLPKWQRGEAPA